MWTIHALIDWVNIAPHDKPRSLGPEVRRHKLICVHLKLNSQLCNLRSLVLLCGMAQRWMVGQLLVAFGRSAQYPCDVHRAKFTEVFLCSKVPEKMSKSGVGFLGYSGARVQKCCLKKHKYVAVGHNRFYTFAVEEHIKIHKIRPSNCQNYH